MKKPVDHEILRPGDTNLYFQLTQESTTRSLTRGETKRLKQLALHIDSLYPGIEYIRNQSSEDPSDLSDSQIQEILTKSSFDQGIKQSIMRFLSETTDWVSRHKNDI